MSNDVTDNHVKIYAMIQMVMYIPSVQVRRLVKQSREIRVRHYIQMPAWISIF